MQATAAPAGTPTATPAPAPPASGARPTSMATASTRVPAPPATAPTTSPFKRPRAACPAAALRALSARPRPHLPPASKPTTERPVTPERRQLFPRRALHPAGGPAQGGSLPVQATAVLWGHRGPPSSTAPSSACRSSHEPFRMRLYSCSHGCGRIVFRWPDVLVHLAGSSCHRRGEVFRLLERWGRGWKAGSSRSPEQ